MTANFEMIGLEARICKESHVLLKRAAEIQGRTLTDFVVSTAQEAAWRVIEEPDVFILSLEEEAQFADALLNSPKPSEPLKRAFAHHKNLIRTR